MAVSWVLKPQHRSRVMFQRFMPWWNAQKRKELAEKKQREEEERLRKEKEEADRVETEKFKANEKLDDKIVSQNNQECLHTAEKLSANTNKERDGEKVSNLDAVDNVTVAGNDVNSDRLKDVQIDNTPDNKETISKKTKISTDTIGKYLEKICNGVVDVNCKVSGNVNGLIGDDQMILKNKLNDHPVKVETDCDKTKFIDSEVDVNDLKSDNRIVVKNGIDKDRFKVLCYNHEQTL